MENLNQIETSEILALAAQIKAEQKELRTKKELERKQKICDLIVTFRSLQPEESDSIIKELLKTAKPSDFYLHYKRTYVNGVQICFYDGSNLTVIENNQIKVSSLPFMIFLRKFKLDIELYYGGKSEIESISNLDYNNELQKVSNSVKIAQNIGVNLTTVVKNTITNKVLSPVIKQQKKAEIKAFKTSLKK
jgi:hypothetical protein